MVEAQVEVPSLRGVRYGAGAGDLWRWAEAAPDERVERFVAAFAGLDGPATALVRAQLERAEFETLLTYVHRCALAAVRTGAGRHAANAIDAISAVRPAAAGSGRDVEVAAALALYAGERLWGGELAEAVAPAIARAEPELARHLAGLLAAGVDLIDDCGYRELDTPAGRVFVEDESEAFAPAADLVGAAYATADALEADRYRVDAIGIGQTLHPIWLGDARNPAAVEAVGRLTGCAHVESRRLGPQSWHGVSVYLAEAADAGDAVRIAEAADGFASPRHPQLGLAVGSLCAVLYASTADAASEPVEDRAGLERFRPVLAAILTGATS